ncbi:hypothetical protein ACIA8O_15955 [Kitasatospora sp. NPDC051853]|uniref:hypothetical protein n=1 Tax=Kitasatospora sp. NPDC051853 TaxID=3364058 RepID=UPI0037A8E01D
MSGVEEAVAGLRWSAIERAAGRHVGADRLIEAGLEALLGGADCPSLRLLAGLGRAEEAEAADLFERVLEELGLVSGLPGDEDQALWAMARWWAAMIVDGRLDPLEGADLILWGVFVPLGGPEELRAITDGAVDREPGRVVPAERKRADTVRAARLLLGGAEAS